MGQKGMRERERGRKEKEIGDILNCRVTLLGMWYRNLLQ